METGAQYVAKPTEALQIVVETIQHGGARRYSYELQVHACAALMKVVPAAQEAALCLLRDLGGAQKML